VATLSSAPGEYVIAANDPIFLLKECRLCFYRKVRMRLPRPSTPFPGLFSQLAASQSTFFMGRQAADLADVLPAGKVISAERWVRSEPIDVPGHRDRIVIRGRIDLGLGFDDGSFGLADLKTARPDPGLPAKYFPQLSLYTLALERPAIGQYTLNPITEAGLLVMDPGGMVASDDGYSIPFKPTWMPVRRDDAATFTLLSEILDLVENPSPPSPSEGCKFCKFRSI